jgi:hypothetical protein
MVRGEENMKMNSKEKRHASMDCILTDLGPMLGLLITVIDTLVAQKETNFFTMSVITNISKYAASWT